MKPIYKPEGDRVGHECQLLATSEGEVTLYVGGVPVLILDPGSRCLRLVASGPALGQVGLVEDFVTHCAHVVRPKAAQEESEPAPRCRYCRGDETAHACDCV